MRRPQERKERHAGAIRIRTESLGDKFPKGALLPHPPRSQKRAKKTPWWTSAAGKEVGNLSTGLLMANALSRRI